MQDPPAPGRRGTSSAPPERPPRGRSIRPAGDPPGARDEAERERRQLADAAEARETRRQQLADKAQTVKQKVDDELAALKAGLGRPK